MGEYVYRVHPNLRQRTQLKFTTPDLQNLSKTCDIIFIATPHGEAVDLVPRFLETGMKVIDLSANYRLHNPADYERWYNWKHKYPDLLHEAVYGLPELHRNDIQQARLIACPGCMPTATILGLAPLIKESLIEEQRIVVDVKIGSSGGGATPTPASHHPERFGGIRAYHVEGHRHIPEIEQELNALTSTQLFISFTAHAVNMVRGILATIHCFPKKPVSIPQIWRIYRPFYKNEPFVRLVRDMKSLYRFPNPNIIIGSNYCDLGFEIDNHFNHLIIFSAIDNMVKGGAGQGIQCLNIILGLDEQTGLEYTGFHPM